MLKLDPKNTELLEQKQKLLNEAIEQTEKKLDSLKKLKEEADRKMAEGTQINEENYRALQREIANTQNKLMNLKTENSGWNKAGNYLTNLGTELDSIAGKLDSIGNKLTVGVTVPIVAGFTAMTKSAIETETAMQQVDRIYGKAAESIKEFAENKAIDYNMSASEAYKYSQIYGNLIQSITNDQTENAKKTQELLKASSVIASATGRDMSDVMDRIRSGLLGNTEAIEDLGVNVNVALLQTTDAFKKIAKNRSWKQLTFQEQQQIRLMGILEQTAKKYGNEVNKNTSSSIQQLTAKTKNLTSSLGEKLLPTANKLLEEANKLVDKFGNLSDSEQENIIKIGLMVAAVGPLLKVGSTLIDTIGSVSTGIGTMTQAIGVATGKMTSSKDSVNNLAGVLQATFSPTGLAVIGITAAVGIIVAAMAEMEREVNSKFSTMGESATNFYTGIQNAEGYLNTFKTTMFATTKEQQNLQTQMDEIQKGITRICKTASDERRDYTKQEIKQLDEYFKKLRDLKNREIEIQQQIAGAISQQATTNAETFKGSLEEYKLQSQEWIATAQQQAEKTISIIEEGTIQEIALLNQRYGTEATMQNEAYATEYNKIIENKQKKIDLANEEVAKVMSVYSKGYADRANQDGDFYEHIKHYNWRYEEENKRHSKALEDIQNDTRLTQADIEGKMLNENSRYHLETQKIWYRMYKDMSESEAEQLGVWLAMLSHTEMYGGEITEENQLLVDNILESYDSMPKKTQEAMKNAMSPMLEEMKKSEPTLWSKATSIADGIISRLKKAFDIHSPSRETRDIFQNVMKGAELGLEDEERALNKQINEIAQKMKTRFENINPNMGEIKQSIIDQTKTVFTTPTLNIYAQDELTPTKINTIIDSVNRRLGSRY